MPLGFTEIAYFISAGDLHFICVHSVMAYTHYGM